MTNEEILKKAIKKAGFEENMIAWWGPEWLDYLLNDGRYGENYYRLIFRGDFAKAFWGESKTVVNDDKWFGSSGTTTYGWRWHLQNMVLEENPIQYLEKYL